MEALILGGTGVLGSLIAARFRARGHTATPVGRDVDVTDVGAVARLATEHDVVVCAVPGPLGDVQSACTQVGTPCVGVNLGADDDGAQQPTGSARPTAAHVVGVGLMPGLSGLMVREVSRAVPGALIEVTLEQSSNARVGIAGMREMFRYIVAGHREAAAPPGSGMLPLAHPERTALAAADVDVSYATRWDTAAQTNVVRGLASAQVLGLVSALPDRLLRGLARHDPARPETVRLLVRAVGSGASAEPRISAVAAGDYPATAAVAVAVATRALALPPGVHRPWDVLELDSVRDEIADVVTVSGR